MNLLWKEINPYSFIRWKYVLTEAARNDYDDITYGSLEFPTRNLNSHIYFLYHPQTLPAHSDSLRHLTGPGITGKWILYL